MLFLCLYVLLLPFITTAAFSGVIDDDDDDDRPIFANVSICTAFDELRNIWSIVQRTYNRVRVRTRVRVRVT